MPKKPCKQRKEQKSHQSKGREGNAPRSSQTERNGREKTFRSNGKLNDAGLRNEKKKGKVKRMYLMRHGNEMRLKMKHLGKALGCIPPWPSSPFSLKWESTSLNNFGSAGLQVRFAEEV